MKLIVLLIAIVLFASCVKKLDHNSYYSCHQSQNLDSTSISNKLVGSWKWTKQYCFWTAKTKKADKNISVIFNSDSTFIVKENSTTETQGNWNIKRSSLNNWSLDLSSFSSYLWGEIRFCGNEVLFNNSPLDGCDNLFVRVN